MHASLSGNNERIACGLCTAAVNQGHRVVRIPCGDGNHVIHATCVLVAVRSSGAQRGMQAPLVAASVGAKLATGDGGPLMPLYKPTPVFEMQPLP